MPKLEDIDQSIYDPVGSGPIELLKCKVCNTTIVGSYHKKHIESDKHRKASTLIDPNDITHQIDAYEDELAKMTLEVVKLTEKMYNYKNSVRPTFANHLKQMDQFKDAKSYRLCQRLNVILSK